MAFLTVFTKTIVQGESGTIIEDGVTYFSTVFDANFDVNGHVGDGRIIFGLRNKTISEMVVDAIGTELAYKMPELLSAYGRPKDIYVLTYQNSPFPFIPFSLVLFYPDQGILAYYELEAQRNGEVVEACTLDKGPELWLWSTQLGYEFLDFEKAIMGTDVPILRPIASVTDLDVESFYSIYSQASAPPCLRTEAVLWP